MPQGSEKAMEALRAHRDLWDLFTRREEYEPRVVDRYGRFPSYASSHRRLDDPVVSRFLVEHGLSPSYPDGKEFAVCLTHDIDTVFMTKKEVASRLIRGDGVRRAVKGALGRTSPKSSPLWNFGRIMDLEAEHGAKSTFFFLALKRGEEDFNYRVEDVREAILEIKDRGWEVGLHGGHAAYDDPARMKEERSRLEKVAGRVTGYRNHYLRFRTPATWRHLADAGFEYDSTFGDAYVAGFRNGMCHPFRPFDVVTGREIPLLEIPLAVMDATLAGYMHLDWERAWHVTERLVEKARELRGVLCVLWHNNYMEGEALSFYRKLLKHCRERNAWLAGAGEIARRWSEG